MLLGKGSGAFVNNEGQLVCGVCLHPWHNMFLCVAHRESDISDALERTDEAFTVVAAAF